MATAIEPVSVDQGYVVRMARELMRIPAENPPGNCEAVAERILAELKSLGVDRIETHEFEKAMPKFNIRTSEEGNGTLRPLPHE